MEKEYASIKETCDSQIAVLRGKIIEAQRLVTKLTSDN